MKEVLQEAQHARKHYYEGHSVYQGDVCNRDRCLISLSAVPSTSGVVRSWLCGEFFGLTLTPIAHSALNLETVFHLRNLWGEPKRWKSQWGKVEAKKEMSKHAPTQSGWPASMICITKTAKLELDPTPPKIIKRTVKMNACFGCRKWNASLIFLRSELRNTQWNDSGWGSLSSFVSHRWSFDAMKPSAQFGSHVTTVKPLLSLRIIHTCNYKSQETKYEDKTVFVGVITMQI